MKEYSFLEPIKVGNITLKNRIILGAMAKYLCTDDGYITEEYIAHYENIARGGAAMVTPGIMVIDPSWPYISQKQPYLSDDKYIPGLKKVADAIHKHGAKFICQLWHAGLANTTISVNDLSLDQIRHIQDQYLSAARRCKQAGADGIEFHIAHTYLPNQFLSPYFNQRTDQYGSDTVENAIRFSIECINQIREELCNDDFLIISKINGNDFVEGGITPGWAAAASVYLEQAGVAMITVNGGGALTKLNGMSDDGREKEGWKIPLAKAVKGAVSIPVAGSGSLRHPDYVDQVIRNGDCDIVALARGLYAEPEWVKKASSGRECEMRHCISCMFCFTAVEKGTSGCSVNPFAKRELEIPELKRDGAGRKVAVIGGGPSGLEAAVTLAERGFEPVVFEKEKELGGLVALAAVPPGKQKLGWMIDYYKAQIERLGTEVHLNTNCTANAVLAIEPYAVVVATGSNEFVPPIEGIKGKNVISVRDVLDCKVDIQNKNVVVLGGGLTGLETARFLKEKKNDVTILEMLPKSEKPNTETRLALQDVVEDNIALKMEHKVVQITENAVIAENLQTGERIQFPADMVVLAMGIRPNDELVSQITERFKKVYSVGDCAALGKISSAVQSGSMIGYQIN